MCRADAETTCKKCGGLMYWAGDDYTGEGQGWQCVKCRLFIPKEELNGNKT